MTWTIILIITQTRDYWFFLRSVQEFIGSYAHFPDGLHLHRLLTTDLDYARWDMK